MSRIQQSLFICLFVTAIAVGCNDSPYEVAPVSGKVTIDGTPITSGKVMFAPVSKDASVKSGKPGFGRLQADGSFTISTYGEQDGAVVGKHWATVITSKDEKHGPNIPRFARYTVRSGTLEVQANQENQFEIDIKAADIRRFGTKD